MLINGQNAGLYHLQNKSGMVAAFTNYGARIVSINIPDRDGIPTNVVAGYDSLSGYLNSTEAYHGATVGRYCNRIANAEFELEGQTFFLTANDGNNSLHGGPKGFHQAVWNVADKGDDFIVFSYLSANMEEGFPGNMFVQLTYHMDASNRLTLTYQAKTDKTTVINLTNHAYFNLNGIGSGSAMTHELQINADNYLPVNQQSIPTGEVKSVKGSAFDFRNSIVIEKQLEDFELKNGFNHNFVLNARNAQTPAVELLGTQSGICLNVYTNQPGVQFYTGDHFNGENILRGGHPDGYRNYIALETQHFPNSVNHPAFPTTVLKPGEAFTSVTTYAFSIKQA